jgi:phospholipid/cholesterol/gamma-HCH transport system permease protein
MSDTLLEATAEGERLRLASARGNQLSYAVASIGENIVAVGRSLAAIVDMLGALAIALLRVPVRPRTFRFTSMVHQLANVGWRAVLFTSIGM